MLSGPFTLVGCKLYKRVAIVICLALTWVRGMTEAISKMMDKAVREGRLSGFSVGIPRFLWGEFMEDYR